MLNLKSNIVILKFSEKKEDRDRNVGEEAAKILLDNIKGRRCADEYLQDQLILYMALADGKSRIKVGPITNHTETAIYVAELLTSARFKIDKIDDNDTNVIECTGIGFKNKTKLN